LHPSFWDIKEQLGVTQDSGRARYAVVMGIADHVLVLDFGRAIAQGSPSEVQANPDVIKAYLGEEFGSRTLDNTLSEVKLIPADDNR